MFTERFKVIAIDPAACTGCNICVDICPMDVLAPNAKKGLPPIVAYPEECWFCGCCTELCPQKLKEAIRVIIPLPMRVSVWKGAKETSDQQR
ncbi:MAG: ferredoxin family protein [Syntrophales bacterium]|nr:ferredoxin family protein [Syntrophales bacterium]